MAHGRGRPASPLTPLDGQLVPGRSGVVASAPSSSGAAASGVVARAQQAGPVAPYSPSAAGAAGVGYWVPDRRQHELGLLETIAKMGGPEHQVKVASRPVQELQQNFTGFRGEPFDLCQPLLLFGKVLLIQRQLGDHSMDSAVPIAYLRDISAALPSMMEDSYLLVTYRDYSEWARHRYPERVQGNSWLRSEPGYVVQHFAVAAGKDPAVFIPISEAQFLHGQNRLHSEVMQRMALSDGALGPFVGLSPDQWQAVAAIGGPAIPGAVGSEAPGRRGAQGAAAADRRSPSSWRNPSWWNVFEWYRQWRDEKYRQIGRMFCCACIAAVAGGVAWRLFIQPVGSAAWGLLRPAPQTKLEQKLETVRSFGMRDVFDHFMAPRTGQGAW
eukprot:TRINITY_DN4618_c0_g1_i2.p1 TRINITY_DN4618_c0_g1~~TRINITY_DN4618_c0_g1_i2.p1  ORF type:complete len:384 (+),score=81.38 TRINITY_DN4618_c0_g1_i2:79-1230(+)